MENTENKVCEFQELKRYCVHKANMDIRMPTANKHKMRRKRCLPEFCPLEIKE